jgi:hypothetical protein
MIGCTSFSINRLHVANRVRHGLSGSTAISAISAAQLAGGPRGAVESILALRHIATAMVAA